MVGGEPEAVGMLEPCVRKLAVPGGYVYARGPGAGHLVKLAHNGIEFGMLQAIGLAEPGATRALRSDSRTAVNC